MCEDQPTKKCKDRTYLEERHPQRWRAYAVFKDGTEAHVFTGKDPVSVKNNFREALEWFHEPKELVENLREIQLMKWVGVCDSGSWKFVKKLEYIVD